MVPRKPEEDRKGEKVVSQIENTIYIRQIHQRGFAAVGKIK